MIQTRTAGCKVNLYLDIIGVRADGYHEIESLFYPLPTPCDTLTLETLDTPGLHLTCSLPTLASAENILVRAYHDFTQATGLRLGLHVHLDKGIPMGAGLGGGSSDAAALLRWLNEQAGDFALPDADLGKLALTLGADVPFFLHNRPAWVTGIGETLTSVNLDLAEYVILVICPDVQVSTRWAYTRWDACPTSRRKLLTPTSSPITQLAFMKPPGLWNCFEDLVFQEFPSLHGIKKEILAHAPVGCVMSGSGSSLVALFISSAHALCCVRRMRALGHACHVTQAGQPLNLES